MRQEQFKQKQLIDAATLLFGYAGAWVVKRMLGIRDSTEGQRRYLRRKDIMDMTGASGASVDRWRKDPAFPQPQRGGYPRKAVERYLEERDPHGGD